MERAKAAKKRRRVARDDTVEASWQQIKCKDLLNPNQVTILPYTGTRKSFLFVGSPDLQKLLWHVLSLEREQELLVVGPKGTGKSCRLRAIANMFYAHGPAKSVIVCVWNMEKARAPLWLLDGLRFAYSGADEHKPVRDAVHKMEEEMEEDGDFSGSGNIGKWMERLRKFLKERAAAGDDFTFIADGEQALDIRGIERPGARELENTFLTLKAIVEPYKVVWGVSPTAHQAVAANLSYSEGVVIYRVRGFTKEQREVFLLHSVLGAVVTGHKQRTKDVDFYAGFHPQFLDVLDEACMEIARIKQLGGCEPGIEWGDGNDFRLAPPAELEPKEVAILLEDEEDWHRVLLHFINGRTMSSIRNTVESIVKRLDSTTTTCDFHLRSEIICQDPRYALLEDKFCSPFVEQIYVEEFRKARSCC
ncbi:hypothetical protein SELMODRAFT_430713 [Selaginella moellendorffii]|uniref:Uncharacterized protein n=1 Tax=Selaginella moellendorffii TaxID=88036 RepID=D8TA99_SELML|nr:hypothetical protein SELMODRAFT_430713 [Selaginella moellendorffii]